MTLENIDDSLPNGLHDAQIASVAHDYSSSVVTLAVNVLVALPDAPESETPYRSAIIQFHGILFCSVEMPQNQRIIGVPGAIWFQHQRLDPNNLPQRIAQVLPEGALCYSLYVLDWESCIKLAAMDVTFAWAASDHRANMRAHRN